MAFVHNWAIMYGDLLIFPVINYLIAKNVKNMSFSSFSLLWILSWMTGVIVSYVFHKSWWKKDENLGHVFSDWETSGGVKAYWITDITRAGWVHFFYMAFQIAILIQFLILPSDRVVVSYLFWLFLAFLAIINAQAFFIQRSFSFPTLIRQLAGLGIAVFIKSSYFLNP